MSPTLRTGWRERSPEARESLVDELIRFESDPYGRSVVLEGLRQIEAGEQPLRRCFEFNLFEITLDGEQRLAFITDVLDSSEHRRLTVHFCTLRESLESSKEARSFKPIPE